jgi:sigma-B regulation protein RsbU (phosphoserine phosphatase)
MTATVATAPRTLIADDQPDVLEALRLLLKGEGHEVVAVTSPAGVLNALATREFDLLLMDLNYTRDTTSGQEGLDLIDRIRSLHSALPVVVMTAWGSVELAMEAVHRGVGDFVLKPWDNERLISILRAQLQEGQARRKAQQQQAEDKLELQDAREIQQALLPTIPQVSGFEISGTWQPARTVSGDYFDVSKCGENRVELCIADVIGKGMPAALLMSNLQAAIKGCACGNPGPRYLVGTVNRIMRGNITSGKFITLFHCRLDLSEKQLAYTNAGHNAPILVRSDGSCQRLDIGGAALGVFKDWEYEQGEVELAAGDRLVLFTDGVTEARSADGEEFGEDRLVEFVKEHQELGAAELQKKILAAVTEFCGGNFQDDATVLALSVGPAVQ